MPKNVKMATPPRPSFEWAGQRLTFEPGRLTGADDLTIFKATGQSIMDIVTGLESGQVSLFGAAVMIWVARRQQGENVTLEAQLAVTTMESVMTLASSFSDEEEVVDPPA